MVDFRYECIQNQSVNKMAGLNGKCLFLRAYKRNKHKIIYFLV